MPVYRYMQEHPPRVSIAGLKTLLPDVPSAVGKQSPESFIDVTVAASSKADLDNVMAEFGCVPVATDPTAPMIKVETVEILTTDDTPTQLWIDPDGPRIASFVLRVSAIETTPASDDDYKFFCESAISFNRNTGGWIVSVGEVVTPHGSAGAAGWTVTVKLAVGNEVKVEVVGEVAKSITWHIRAEIMP